MTVADQLVERGEQRGIERGRREMLLELLHEKSGALPDAVTARVAAASVDELRVWIKRVVLTASALDDVSAAP